MHYVNQFFAGIGGEDKADVPSASIAGPAGPGLLVQKLLGDSAEIVVTAYCGDNHFANNIEESLDTIVRIAREHDVRLLIAGPAFASGRYGFACAEVAHAVSSALGVDCILSMHPENPGIETYKRYKDRKVYAFPAGEVVTGMGEALSRIVPFVLKLIEGSKIGTPGKEGYIPRGFRNDESMDKDGAERAVDMLLDKIAGRTFITEIPIEQLELVPPAPHITDIAGTCIAIAATDGVLPQGNPDGFKAYRNTQWRKYSIEKLNTLTKTDWDVLHGGYNNEFVRENPNYGVPLDMSRRLEQEGAFGSIYPSYYMTTGVNAAIPIMQRIGREMGADMKAEGVDAAFLVSS
jgi:glycine reductase